MKVAVPSFEESFKALEKLAKNGSKTARADYMVNWTMSCADTWNIYKTLERLLKLEADLKSALDANEQEASAIPAVQKSQQLTN